MPPTRDKELQKASLRYQGHLSLPPRLRSVDAMVKVDVHAKPGV